MVVYEEMGNDSLVYRVDFSVRLFIAKECIEDMKSAVLRVELMIILYLFSSKNKGSKSYKIEKKIYLFKMSRKLENLKKLKKW